MRHNYSLSSRESKNGYGDSHYSTIFSACSKWEYMMNSLGINAQLLNTAYSETKTQAFGVSSRIQIATLE